MRYYAMSNESYLAVVRTSRGVPAVRYRFEAIDGNHAVDLMRRRAGVRTTDDLYAYELLQLVGDGKNVGYIAIAQKKGEHELNAGKSLAVSLAPKPTEVKVEEKPYTPYKKSMAA